MITRLLLAALLSTSALALQAQSTDSLETAALKLHYAAQYREAEALYTQVIDAGKRTYNTYFNRGACRAECCDPLAAARDFTAALAEHYSDSALYMRAVCYVKGASLNEAITDLNSLLAANEMFPHARTLRGQARYATGDHSGACADFAEAAARGDEQAQTLRRERCDTVVRTAEGIEIDWPTDNGGWTVSDRYDDSVMNVVVLRRAAKTDTARQEIGIMTSMKRLASANADTVMKALSAQATRDAAGAKSVVIDKGTVNDRTWVIFSITVPRVASDGRPLSQIYYVAQGRQALYIVHRDVRSAKLTTAETKQWQRIFRAARIVQH